MRLQSIAIAACFIAVLYACTAEEHARPEDRALHEPAPAVVLDSPTVDTGSKPAPLGEIVQDLGDRLWIVFQDKKHVYWFGSDGEGLYRVDGKHIVHYTTKDGLCNDQVRQILEDASGNIYVNTCGGISKFDGLRFSTLIPSSSPPSAAGWKLEPGDLWFKGIQNDNGPRRYDGETLQRLDFPRHELESRWRSLFPNVPYSPYATYTIVKDKKGAVWFGTACFGACRFDGESFTWVSEKELVEMDNGPSYGIRGIVEDKDGKLWFSDTLHRYDVFPADPKARGPSAPPYAKEQGIESPLAGKTRASAYFVSGVKARDDALWLATYGAGVWRYDGRDMTRYPVVEGGNTVLLYSIFEDDQGVLWLGTTESGVYRFNGEAFERFRP